MALVFEDATARIDFPSPVHGPSPTSRCAHSITALLGPKRVFLGQTDEIGPPPHWEAV